MSRRRKAAMVSILFGAAALVAGGLLFVPRMGSWLEVVTPIHRADVVVALGGDRTRQEAAADLFHRGLADRVQFVGYDARERDYECLGIPSGSGLPLPPACYTTGEEARAVERIVAARGFRSLIVVTSPFHSRRARAIFRRALGGKGIEIMVFTTRNPRYRTDAWWKDHMGVKSVISEYVALVYYWIHGGI